MRPTLIGIDPGKQGAVAVLHPGRRIRVFDTPLGADGDYNPHAMRRILDRESIGVEVVVALELVHSMPRQSVVSMFSMGRGVGIWEGVVASVPAMLTKVDPQRWKRHFLAGYKERGGDAGKLAAEREVSRLFPYLVLRTPKGRLLDGRADAVGILMWARGQHW